MSGLSWAWVPTVLPSLHPNFFPGNSLLQHLVIISISLISVGVCGGVLLGTGSVGGGVGVGGGRVMGSLLVIGSVVGGDSVGCGGVSEVGV